MLTYIYDIICLLHETADLWVDWVSVDVVMELNLSLFREVITVGEFVEDYPLYLSITNYFNTSWVTSEESHTLLEDLLLNQEFLPGLNLWVFLLFVLTEGLLDFVLKVGAYVVDCGEDGSNQSEGEREQLPNDVVLHVSQSIFRRILF